MGESWRDVVRDAVAVRAASSPGGHGATPAVSRVGFSPNVMPYLAAAAAARGISVAGYIRRATMARVGHDLGIDPLELFAIDLALSPHARGGGGGRLSSRDLDGSLYGRWEVCADDSGSHHR